MIMIHVSLCLGINISMHLQQLCQEKSVMRIEEPQHILYMLYNILDERCFSNP